MSSDEQPPDSRQEPPPEPESLPKEPNAVLETAPPIEPSAPPASHARLPLTRLMLGALFVAGGVLWLLGALNVIDVSVTASLSVALIVVGLALVGGSFTGRRHWGLIVVGVVLATTLAVASTFDIELNGGVGERSYQPASLAELRSQYQLGVGQLTIDLTGLTFVPGTTTRVEATVGIGQLTVHVSGGFVTSAHGTAGLGEVLLFGRQSSGFEVDLSGSLSRPGPAPVGGFATVVLELSVGLGQVTVDGA